MGVMESTEDFKRRSDMMFIQLYKNKACVTERRMGSVRPRLATGTPVRRPLQ